MEPCATPEVLDLYTLGVAYMNCSEFLDLYSDYRDGCLESTDVARSVREHLRECDACMRYDALICRGVMTLRSTEELEPTSTVSFRGLHVLPDSAEPVSPAPARFAGGLMVAAAIALLLWPKAEEPVPAAPIAQVQPAPPPTPAVLPQPKPLPAREIDPAPSVFHAQMPPPPEQVTFAEWVAVPD